jgi:probable rRNA maturation factor
MTSSTGYKRNIWFFSEGTNYVPPAKGKIREWINSIIHKEGYKAGEISIIFCTDAYLSEINVKYLKHNTLTDIITFDLSEQQGIIQGDIYISIERAKENAKAFRVSLKAETSRLMVHGILHLAGYNDKTPEEKMVMTSKEDYYLSLPSR